MLGWSLQIATIWGRNSPDGSLSSYRDLGGLDLFLARRHPHPNFFQSSSCIALVYQSFCSRTIADQLYYDRIAEFFWSSGCSRVHVRSLALPIQILFCDRGALRWHCPVCRRRMSHAPQLPSRKIVSNITRELVCVLSPVVSTNFFLRSCRSRVDLLWGIRVV